MRADRRLTLTPKQLAVARRLRASHMTWGWDAIAIRIGCSYELIRRALDPDYATHRNAMIAKRRAAIPPDTVTSSGNVAHGNKIVPPDVLADRERRQQAPLTITAMLCGDPPPGWSALDQKNGRAQ